MRLDKAIADYSTWPLNSSPNFARSLLFDRGRAKVLTKGDFDEASCGFYAKAIELKPDDTDTYYHRGIAYLRKKDYDLAIEDFNKDDKTGPRVCRHLLLSRSCLSLQGKF